MRFGICFIIRTGHWTDNMAAEICPSGHMRYCSIYNLMNPRSIFPIDHNRKINAFKSAVKTTVTPNVIYSKCF